MKGIAMTWAKKGSESQWKETLPNNPSFPKHAGDSASRFPRELPLADPKSFCSKLYLFLFNLATNKHAHATRTRCVLLVTRCWAKSSMTKPCQPWFPSARMPHPPWCWSQTGRSEDLSGNRFLNGSKAEKARTCQEWQNSLKVLRKIEKKKT